MKTALILVALTLALTFYGTAATAQVSSLGSLALHYTTDATLKASNTVAAPAKIATPDEPKAPAVKHFLNALPGYENPAATAPATFTGATAVSGKSMNEELDAWVSNQLSLQKNSRRKRR